MEKYKQWIKEYGKRQNDMLLGKCQSATKEMKAAFPELEIVAGWCSGMEHFWCVTPEGVIVDPTEGQFIEHYGIFELEYVPWKPGDEVRVGKCMSCGESIYKAVTTLDGPRASFCGDDCYSDYARACG